MERPPLDEMDTAAHAALPAHVVLQQWRRLPPVLRGTGVTLREVRLSDAPALMTMLAADHVAWFTSPAPPTLMGLIEAIEQMQAQRMDGKSLTLAVVPDGYAFPAGLFQLRQSEPEFSVTEWSFALGNAFWGSGLFFASAPVVADFVFDVLNARRLEARVSVRNGRGTGALRKLGAVQEALLRESLMQGLEHVDQVLWAILAEEWRARRPSGVQIH